MTCGPFEKEQVHGPADQTGPDIKVTTSFRIYEEERNVEEWLYSQ